MEPQIAQMSTDKKGEGECLDFTAEELLNELAQLFGIEERRAGDLELAQIRRRLGVCNETIRMKMNELIDKKLWERVWVMDGGKKIRVYRKKE